MNHANALAAKVAAVNRANAEARRLYPLLVAAFAPYYGQKVIKVNGDVLASVEKTLPPLPGWGDTANRLCVYRNRVSSYALSYVVKVSENYAGPHGDQCVYHEVTIYPCDLDGPNAKAPSGGGEWVLTARTDWTAEEVSALRVTAAKAREAARNAESALQPFGEYDR